VKFKLSKPTRIGRILTNKKQSVLIERCNFMVRSASANELQLESSQ